MPDPRTFSCPKCGAPITFHGERQQVTCAYCGNTVTVPEELRGPRIEPPRHTVSRKGTLQTEKAEGRGCGAVLVALALLLIGGVAALVLISSTSSGTESLTSGLVASTDGRASPTPGFARLVTSFGGEGTGPGLFQDVRHIALDGQGNLYVAEYDTLRIQKFDNTGSYVSGWTIDETPTLDAYRRRGPDAIAADVDGHVYALWDRSLLKYDGRSGQLLARFSLENGRLGTEMVVYGNTLIAFADTGFDDTLLWIDTDSGQVVRRAPNLLSGIVDDNVFVNHIKLAVDGLGNLFVLYTFPDENQAVYRFSPDGRYLDRFVPKPAGEERPTAPDNIAVDNRSRVYVSNVWEISVFEPDGGFLDAVVAGVYDNVISAFAIDRQNGLFVLNRSTSQIYKLRLID
jgi:sugar lactone lactonase YvrE